MVSACALALAGPIARAEVRDLPRSDPDRKALLDAARGGESLKFVVRDFFKADDLAFLCALAKESGGVVMTDEAIDVYAWLFVRDEGGRWRARSLAGGLTMDMKNVSCDFAPSDAPEALHHLDTRDELLALFDLTLREELQDALAYAQPLEEGLALLQLLEKKGLTAGVPLDRAKQPLTPDQLKRMKDACGARACDAKNERTRLRLERVRTAETLGSLAWERCNIKGVRANDLGVTARCLKEAAALPACRPGLRLSRDLALAEACMAALPL